MRVCVACLHQHLLHPHATALSFCPCCRHPWQACTPVPEGPRGTCPGTATQPHHLAALQACVCACVCVGGGGMEGEKETFEVGLCRGRGMSMCVESTVHRHAAYGEPACGGSLFVRRLAMACARCANSMAAQHARINSDGVMDRIAEVTRCACIVIMHEPQQHKHVCVHACPHLSLTAV